MIVDTYAQVKKIKPKGIRSVVRDAALFGLSLQTNFPSYNKYVAKNRIQFLYIHHVFKDEEDKFDRIIQELLKGHTFIPHSEAVQRILSGDIDKPYISISSDDGFKNNLQAAEILDRYGIKCCFFINPDTIGLKDYDRIKSFCSKRLNFPPVSFLDWNDIDHLMKKGHEIGSHGMGHLNLANTDLALVESNVNESFEIIKSKCGSVKHFAYPYGRFFHFNSACYDLVFDAGFVSCASAERGCHISNGPIEKRDLMIRRDQIICDWNLEHIKYFLMKNSQNASVKNNIKNL